MKEWYIKNRRKLADAIEGDFAAVFFAGRAPKQEGDELYPFSPERNFLYLTGIDAPGAALVLGRAGEAFYERLYIEGSRGEMAKWIGESMTPEEVRRYYYHGVSHYLGLETHDTGRRDAVLAPGMVLTVEPGLYIEEWGIGIRIEDDVLVTETGREVLSAGIIKEPEEIEAFMGKGRQDAGI